MKQEYIDPIRAFNRFYTKVLSILNKYFIRAVNSDFPRFALFRIYLRPGSTSKEISGGLNMDKGLLSRLLKRFEQKGYTDRKEDEKDGCAGRIGPTGEGCRIYHRLNAAADSAKEIFGRLEERRLRRLIKNMDSIRDAMSNPGEDFSDTEPIVVRPMEEADDAAVARTLRASVEEHDAPKVGTFYDDPHTDAMYRNFRRKDAEYWVVECDSRVAGGGGFYRKGMPNCLSSISDRSSAEGGSESICFG